MWNSKIKYTDSRESVDKLLELQQKYDELLADSKDLLSVVCNLIQGRDEPRMVEFNNPHGFSAVTLDLIRRYAYWKYNFTIDNEQDNEQERTYP